MNVNVDSEPLLDDLVGPDAIHLIVGVGGPHKGILLKIGPQLPGRIAAPRVQEEPVHKIGGDPVEKIFPPISRLIRIWVISSKVRISSTDFSSRINNPLQG